MTRSIASAYYRTMMPFSSIVSWLSREGDVPLDEYDICFMKDADMKVVNRHGHYASEAELRDAFFRRGADRIDIGERHPHAESAYRTQFIVFDLDATDYKLFEVARDTPADSYIYPNAHLTKLQWQGMALSVCFLNHYLREVIFEHTDAMKAPKYKSFAVFSGRRGFHLWLSNRCRDKMNDSAVRMLVARLDSLGTRQGALEALEQLDRPLDVANDDERFTRREVMLDVLADFATSTLSSEGFWQTMSTAKQTFLDDLTASWGTPLQPTAACFQALMQRSDGTAPSSLGADETSQSMFSVAQIPYPLHRRSFWVLAGIMLIAPHVDHNVILGDNHLIKCPFSLHSVTQLPSVPVNIDPSTVHHLMNHPERHIYPLSQLFSAAGSVLTETRLRFASTVALFEDCVG